MNTPDRLTSKRKSRLWLRRLAGILFGLILAWLAAEIALRAAFEVLPPKIQADIQQVRRVPWDETKIIPPMPFTIDQEFQVRMPVGLKDYPVRWSDARFAFDTLAAWEGHRAGLRGPAPVYPLDAMIFGDSFAFCWTTFADCFSQRIAIDHGWKIFNAAIPGTGTTGQYNLMRELVPAMKPRLIVWTWFNNDLSDNYDLARIRGEVGELAGAPADDPVLPPKGLAAYSAVLQILSANLNPPARITPYRHFQEIRIDNRPFLAHTNEYVYPTHLSYPRTQYGWDRMAEAYTAAQALAAENGAHIVLVIIPTKEETYAPALTGLLGEAYLKQMAESREKLLALCAEQGWYCLDPLAAFQDSARAGQTVYYGYDSHLDASGNETLADLLGTYLIEQNLLPVTAP